MLGATAASAFSFGGVTNYQVGARPDGLTFADFDKDGDNDLALSVDTPDRVQIMFNNGDGTYGFPVSYQMPGGSGPGAMVAADVDSDGDADIAVALHNSNQVLILLNNGNGTFTQGSITGVGLNPVRIATADFDGNGSPDFVTANRDANTLTVMRNTGSGFVTSTYATGEEPRGVAAGDLNGDGRADIVTTSKRDRNMSVLFNQGGGVFGSRINYSVGNSVRPDGITLGDLDKDGDLDVVVGVSDDGPGFAAVLKNSGNGTLSGLALYPTGGLDSDIPTVGDLDNDGDLDIAITNESSGNVSALPNSGTGTFGAATVIPTGTTPEDVIIGDLDRDGDADIAAVNRDSNTLSVILNNAATPVILPSSFSVTKGVQQGGTLADLFSSDDARIVIQQRPGFSASDPNAQLLVEGTAGVQQTGTLTFRFEGSSSGVPSNKMIQRIELFDFQANAWVQLDQRAPTTTDSVIDVVVTQNAGRFIQSGTTLMRARISWFDRGAITPNWQARIDQTVWKIS